jgi:hypothetical protein
MVALTGITVDAAVQKVCPSYYFTSITLNTQWCLPLQAGILAIKFAVKGALRLCSMYCDNTMYLAYHAAGMEKPGLMGAKPDPFIMLSKNAGTYTLLLLVAL